MTANLDAFATMSKKGNKMKKKLLLPIAMMLSLVGNAADTGYIYEIRPWQNEGSQGRVLAASGYTADNPAKGGEKLWFVMRVLNSNWSSCVANSVTNWTYPKYLGTIGGSESAAWAASAPKIGIVVSGRTVGATIEAIGPDTYLNSAATPAKSGFYTDIVCSYTVQPGDIALPIRLAADNNGTPIDSTDTVSSFKPFIINGDLWKWYDAGNGTTELEFEWATFGTPTQQAVFSSGPEGDARVADSDLSKACFYVKTVDFTDRANENGTWYKDGTAWRGVHEGGTSVEPSLASITITGTSTDAVKLYVWSEDDNVIKMASGTSTTMKSKDGLSTIDRIVYTVEFAAGETVKTVPLQAVAAEGATTSLVLSQFQGFRTMGSGAPETDYLTIPVAVIEKEKASVTAVSASEKVTVPADADAVSTPIGTITLKISGGYQTQAGTLSVTLTPSLQDGTEGASNYVHIAASDDGAAWSGADPLVFNYASDPSAANYDADFAAGNDITETVYVYALGADEHTSTAGHAIYFTPTLDAAAEASHYFAATTKAVMYFQPAKPALSVPADYSAVGGTSRAFEFTVGDNYKNFSNAAGYTILYKQKASDNEFKELAGKWKPNAQGVLVSTADSTKLPALTYAYAETPYTSVFKVKTPGGDLESNEATTTVTVSQPAVAMAYVSADGGTTFTASATFTEDFSQADGLEVPVHVTLSETYSDPLWAFLAVTDPAMTNFVAGSVLTNSAGAVGMKIANTGPESAEGYITLLDGGKGSGNNIQFNVILCTQETFDPAKIDTYFQSGNTLTIKMKNAAPKVNAVTMDGLTSVYTSGDTMQTPAAQGVDKKFTFEIGDVTADLGKDFAMKYQIQESDGTGASGELKGNPAETNVTHTFQSPGTATVRMWVKDKDMSAYAAQADFYFYVTVSDHPSMSIRSENGDSLPEGQVGPGQSRMTLVLSENTSNKPLDVEITVASADSSSANPGLLRLGGVTNRLDDAGLPVNSNKYYTTLRAKQTNFSFYIDESDGTKTSMQKGFILTPKIITETEVPTAPGIKWSDYFVSDTLNLAIENVAPTLVCSLGEENTSTNGFAAAIGNGDPITWSVGDIDIDLAGKLTVQWWTTDYGNETATNVTDELEHTFIPRFKSSGVKQVRVTVTDKDKDTGVGTTTRTWFFEVEASKTLTTTASGPSGGISTSNLSQKYAKAKGRGEGHVYSDTSFAGANGFALTWNCGLATKANVWGFGYQVGAVDDGRLNGTVRFARDIPLDANGANTTDGTKDLPSGYYTYWDPVKDSFFYTWLITTTENGTSTTTVYGGTAAPELKGQREARGEIALPDQKAGDGVNYPETSIEGIFSKEYKARDNMGDINQDGVPDLFATVRTWGDGSVTLVSVDGTGSDLADLRDDNRDNDFLPAANQIEQAAIVPGAGSDWSGGQPFATPIEVRGFHDGLNYGMFRFHEEERERWVSDLDMSEAEIAALNRYVQERNDWNTNEFTNLMTDHDVMTNAQAYIAWTWRNFGGEGEDGSTWGFTVENRTDPTTDDTDGDGMPDGYEYYFWYAATVGFDKAGTPITGKKFNLKDVESPTDISSADISGIFNPNVNRDWSKQDTDGDGILDTEEVLIGTNPVQWDTDRDGLSDLYELMYGIDPLQNNAKGNNGAFNGDGDFMAKDELGSYQIITVGGSSYAVDEIVSILGDEPGPGTNTVTILGFKVVGFAGGWMPEKRAFTEASKRLAYRFVFPDAESPFVSGKFGLVTLYHYQVYCYHGFDPRTGWYRHNDGSLSPVRRWFKKGNARSAGVSQNTVEFSALDEFRLIKYRYLHGLADYNKDANDIAKHEDPIQKLADIVRARSTNPNAARDAATYGSKTYGETVHGADTDQDGVPDGWELYIGVNPNIKFTDRDNEGLYNEIREKDAADSLTLAGEFAGTDTCLAYQNCESIYVNYPGQDGSIIKGWYNKFFPTDPRSSDTDGDGIGDGAEGESWETSLVINRWGQEKFSTIAGTPVRVTHYSIYGEPDPSISRCVRGGGFNPCTIDTDMDGLPDPWEYQYAGILFYGDSPAAGVLIDGQLDPDDFDDLRAAAVAYNRGSSTNDAMYYVCMGMDGTCYDSNSEEANRDKDWDADGLENWQEYMVQALRHLRYDDCVNPLNGYDMPVMGDDGKPVSTFYGSSGYIRPNLKDGYSAGALEAMKMLLGYDNFADFAAENSDYIAKLGYFADPPREWDAMNVDFGYKYMLPPHTLRQRSTTRYVNDSTNEYGHVIWTGSKYTYEYDLVEKTMKVVLSTDPADQITYTNNTQILDAYTAFNQTTVTNAQLTISDETGSFTNNYYLSTTVVPVKAVTNEWIGATRYVSTDPRLWDSDADGMDDFYELFHGLNPILGKVGELSISELATPLGVMEVVTVMNASDVIAEAYGSGVNTYRNGFVGWQNNEPLPYDPVRYPWMMGAGACDADGDGIRNEEEALLANLTTPGATHTDPTPLWMTDPTIPERTIPVTSSRSYTNSVVISTVTFPDGTVFELPHDQWIVVRDVIEYPVTNGWVSVYGSPSYVAQYYFSPWSGPSQDPGNTENNSRYGWAATNPYAFEVNEGYDTDADWKADRSEQQSVVEPTSDPQNFLDPSRRQSITFGSQGSEGVAISYAPTTRENYTSNADFLKQFTVEAWLRPETAASGAPQYAVTRSSNYAGWDLSNTVAVIRHNFAIGLTADGRAFAEFNDSTDGRVYVEGSYLADAAWTHVAATFDGSELKIYVNGTEIAAKQTTLIPANGVTGIVQDPQTDSSAYFPVVSYHSVPAATVLGGRASGAAAFGAEETAKATSWNDVAADFYKGSLDEVRVWDGARTPSQIQADFRTRYTVDKISQMRMSTYLEYSGGARRNDTDANGQVLSPELIQHYTFAALPGATEPQYVQKLPAGFMANVPAMVNSDVGAAAVKVGWWNAIVGNSVFKNSKQVYDNGYAVPWVHNTVGHLPRLSGSVEDSVYWGEYLAGYTPASFQNLQKFSFPNTMNPYNLVSGYGVDSLTSVKFRLVAAADESGMYDEIRNRYRYDIRRSLTGTSDLVPLGDAFAKRLADTWDGEGAEDAWGVTSDGAADGDPDDDGIPEWAVAAGYTTAEAYARALAEGLLPDGSKNAAYASAADLDSNGVPDWWQDMYNLGGYGAHDDPDHDGLSIWQEFLVSQGAAYAQGVGADNWPSNLNPRASITDESKGKVRDYFRAGGADKTDQYIGEIVGDHDFMEDWWERSQGVSYASTSVYDPYSDADGDGWSAWAECRYSLFTAMINANTISHSVGGYEVKGMPVPAIRLTLAYAGDPARVAGHPLVVQTFTAAAASRADATFVLDGTSTNLYNRFIGMWGERTVRGTLTPGNINQNSLQLEFLGIDKNDDYSWYLWNEGITSRMLWHGTYEQYLEALNEYGAYGWTSYNPSTGRTRRGRVQLLSSQGNWARFDSGEVSVTTDDEIKSGYICVRGERIGTIDLSTGDYSIDLTTLGTMHLDGGTNGAVNISSSLIRMAYAASVPNIGASRLSVSLGNADEGYVKEGENTIVAFYDLNGDGAYTAGEPFGTASGVDVGWYRTANTIIELSDTSPVMPRITLGSVNADRKVIDGDAGRVTLAAAPSDEAASSSSGEGETVAPAGAQRSTYRIVRTAINGEETASRQTVFSRTLSLANRSYLYEGDVIAAGRLGLDWGSLATSVRRLGLDLEKINTVEYALERMSVDSNGVASATELLRFVTTYNALRGKAVPVAPKGGQVVCSAKPVFKWTSSDSTMTAFRLQVRVADGDIVYDSGDRRLPGSIDGEYVFSPELYANFAVTNGASVFADGADYQWRIALMNSKFSSVAEKDWSDWTAAAFSCAIEPEDGSLTGYGKVAAAVRYYGPAQFEAKDVIVEAYDTPDFSGAPLARTRLDDGALVADRHDIASTNALFKGVQPGEVYLLAFIDRNNNGVRDRFETWGYANQVDVYNENIYSPNPVLVQEEAVKTPSAVIYMEDTDVNQNGIVDAKEDLSDLESATSSADSDFDGLADTEESSYGSDPYLWDTDGDGMPDGWEALFADTDPIFSDAEYVEEGDVMAYVATNMTVVTLWNGTDVASATNKYVVSGLDGEIFVGDDASAAQATFSRVYDYAGKYGLGREIAAADLAGLKVYSVEPGAEVVLVHAQVYDAFGFSPNTANSGVPAEESVNTKAFTALDKYLVVHYRENVLGDADEAAMNLGKSWRVNTLKPGDLDNDKDGIDDGWELYVKHSPWDYTDRTSDVDGDGLDLLHEYDGGMKPTDPLNGDTDGDGVGDKASVEYLFKGGATGDGLGGYRGDADNDQLSNFIEYMISGLDGFPETDPEKDLNASAMSTFAAAKNQLVPDYFLPQGKLYLGEMFADHDMIEDWWEDGQPVEIDVGAVKTPNYSRYRFDATADSDGDGWSNWAEARLAIAGGLATVTTVTTNTVNGVATVVTNNTVASAYELAGGRPAPTVAAAFRYNGDKSRIGSGDTLVVKAWSTKKSTLGTCDAAWVMPVGDLTAGLLTTTLGEPTEGALREGDNMFVAYISGSSSESSEETAAVPAFAVTKPYGVATGVEVGYSIGEPFTIELTDVDATTMRIDLATALTLQGNYAAALNTHTKEWWVSAMQNGSEQWYEYYSLLNEYAVRVMETCTDRGAIACDWVGLTRPIDYAGTNMTFATSDSVHVWVAQMLINGRRNSSGLYYKPLFEIGAVDLANHGVITEADMLSSGELDLGWSTLRDSMNGNWSIITNAAFGIIIEKKPVSYPNENNVLLAMVENHYESGSTQTPVTYLEATATAGRPTFKWRHDNTIGKAYPAFRLRVWTKTGNKLVYDSGDLRAPARDANGVYSWTAPIYVGAMTPEGVVFAADTDYVCGVSMLDAKFTSVLPAKGEGRGNLRVSDSSGSAGISDYGTIAVAVKYMGPGTVNVEGAKCVIRVEAYETPDFSGAPVAAGYVKNADTIGDIDKIALNALVRNLPKRQEYYVLAYLDSNGDGVRQASESWGYGCWVGDPERRDVYSPRAYGVSVTPADDLKVPTCVIYLEDCDTNNNKLPDAMEVDEDGEFAPATVEAAETPYVVTVGSDGKANALNLFESIQPDVVTLPYYSTLVEMENGGALSSPSLALAMSGIDFSTLNVDPVARITQFSLDEGIVIEVDTRATVNGETLVASPLSTATFNVKLTITVEYTETLAGEWSELGTVTEQFNLPAGAEVISGDRLGSIKTKVQDIFATKPQAFFRVKADVVKE